MNEEEIGQILTGACQDPSLYFQVLQEAPYLQIYINRPPQGQLDYTALTEIICSTISQLQLPGIEMLALYSRILGEVQPDWETLVTLTPTPQLPLPQTDDVTEFELPVSETSEQLPLTIQEDITEFELPVSETSEQSSLRVPDPTLSALDEKTVRLEPLTAKSETTELLNRFADEEVAEFEQTQMLDEEQTVLQPLPSSEDQIAFQRPSEELSDLEQLLSGHELEDDEEITEAAPPMPLTEMLPVADENSEQSQQHSVHQQGRSLSEYCFIRNRRLLSAELPIPSVEVARAVKFLHELSASQKQQVLPVLAVFLESPQETETARFSEQLRQWFAQMRELEPEQFRKLRIWLSRYCAEPESTLAQVNAALEAEAAIEAAQQEAELAREAAISAHREPTPVEARSSSLNSELSPDAATTAARTKVRRPVGITILAVLQAIGGLLSIIGSLGLFALVGLAVRFASNGAGSIALLSTLALMYLVVGIASLVLCYGLLMLKGWAWMGTLVVQILGVLLRLLAFFNQLRGFPVFGVVITAVIIYYLLRPNIKQAFGK